MTNADAALLNVDPVNIRFSPEQNIQAIEITNEDESAIALQFDIKNWQQDINGNDMYSNTNDLLVTPSLVTIPSGHTQLVRISLHKKVTTTTEKCYRLIIREILPADNASISKQRNLKISLQMILPIFTNTKSVSHPIYNWSFDKTSDNKTMIKVTNRGSNHFLVTELCLKNRENLTLYQQSGLFSYILPGASRKFKLDFPYQALNEIPLELQVR